MKTVTNTGFYLVCLNTQGVCIATLCHIGDRAEFAVFSPENSLDFMESMKKYSDKPEDPFALGCRVCYLEGQGQDS